MSNIKVKQNEKIIVGKVSGTVANDIDEGFAIEIYFSKGYNNLNSSTWINWK